MADEIAQLVPGDAPGTIRASYDPDFVPRYDAQGNVFLIPIPDDEDGPPVTADVIASYDRELVHAGRKRQTLLTYRKAWKQFEAAFERLPTDRDLILDYLGNFDGPSGRYRLNNQDSIHYLYKHAVSLGWMVSDPMYGMKRPNIQEQMPNPMTLEQVGMVLALDMSLRERAAAHLLAGHGWRQNEVLEVLAGEVRAISGGQIWCHGKHKNESAPVLPETAELLSRLADGLADDEQVFRGKRGRNEKFGYEGMRKLVRDLMGRAGLSGFTGHNLRDTFATLVTEESGDLTLAMQLIRDKVPGVALRYVQRDLPALLEQYSPIRQLERKPSPQKGESGVLVGESLVETGES
jgi:integrase